MQNQLQQAKKGVDGGDVRYLSGRHDHPRLVERSHHGQLEDKEIAQNPGILESVLAIDVYGRDIFRGENALRSVHSGPLENVNQPVVGLVSGVSQISV